MKIESKKWKKNILKGENLENLSAQYSPILNLSDHKILIKKN